MINRRKVFEVINGERRYQDAQYEKESKERSKARFEMKVHSVGAELTLMKVYLDKALVAFTENYGDAPALHAIRKVAALAVRCMENHGALPREEK